MVLQVEHFQVLLAALEGDAVADSAWVPVFHDLKDHIFVAMCDPECSELALGVMAKFMFDSALQHEVLKVASDDDDGVHGSLAHSLCFVTFVTTQSSTLVGSMLLLHRPSPEPNDQVKAGLAQLLQQVRLCRCVLCVVPAFYATALTTWLSD